MNRDPVSSYLDKLSPPPLRRNDHVSLRRAVTEFSRGRRAVRNAVAPALGQRGDFGRLEKAATKLIAAAKKLESALTVSLSRIKLRYAVLWGQRHFGFDELDGGDHAGEPELGSGFPELAAPSPGHAGRALSMNDAIDLTRRHIETLREMSEQTFEGSSHDGRVTVRVNASLEILDLDLDTAGLGDPGYVAALIEAVNAAIGPVHQRKELLTRTLLNLDAAGDQPAGEASAEGGDERAGHGRSIAGLIEALEVFEAVTEEMGWVRDCARQRAVHPDLEPRVTLALSDAEELEELVRQGLVSLKHYRARVEEMFDGPIRDDDLDELEGLVPLFLETDLDDVSELAQFAGAFVAREFIETVAVELRRRQEEQRAWHVIGAQVLRRLTPVEAQTFEGRSEDASATARASGKVRLVELEVDTAHPAAAVKSALIEAVNAAIDTAFHNRSRAMMVTPFG